MIQLTALGSHPNVNNKHYIIDAATELSSIPDATFGVTAYCIADGKTYVVNGSGSFVEMGDNCPSSVKGAD